MSYHANPNSIRCIATIKGSWAPSGFGQCLSLWQQIQILSIFIKNFNKCVYAFAKLNPLNVDCCRFSFHCLLCTESQASDIPRTLRLRNSFAAPAKGERNVSSFRAGLNSVLDFCLLLLLFGQLTDASYTPNLHSALKNYP